MKERIDKISIPDEDVSNWMQTLREGGFTDKEIDSIIGPLNPTYAGLKREEYINRELLRMQEEVRSRSGRELTTKELEELRRGIESRLKK
jgi:hypothetical protein